MPEEPQAQLKFGRSRSTQEFRDVQSLRCLTLVFFPQIFPSCVGDIKDTILNP